MPPELAPGLDLYGTNEGVTLFDEGDDESGETGEAQESLEGSHSLSVDNVDAMPKNQGEKNDQNANTSTPTLDLSSARLKMMQRLRKKLKEQEEYIETLEDQLLVLQELVDDKAVDRKTQR
jgi:hypothetical protein